MKLALILALFTTPVIAAEPVLIIDGRNNHDWQRTTAALKATLTATGLFDVDVATAPEDKAGSPPERPKVEDEAYRQARADYFQRVKLLKPDLDARWARWTVDFSRYKAVVLNYNGPEWQPQMKQGFTDFVKNGGGTVLIHAANNAFANWQDFNDMIAVGWRKGDFGRCLVVNNDGSIAECCAGEKSAHGSQHAFGVTHRQPKHPILAGLPTTWMHAKDELYHHMRGPANNVTILASAFSDPEQHGTGRHEPVLWETAYGRGRVIVCSMGHLWRNMAEQPSLDCVGFQTLVNRSVAYVATGSVTLPVPPDFPTPKAVSLKPAK